MSSAMDLKTKEEKDAELDRRIEALRKKNQALVKRYQEIEEDKKKAEQEGIAVTTPRKPRPHDPDLEKRRLEKENFTVTVDLSKPQEKRVVNDTKPGPVWGQKVPEENEEQKGQSPSKKTSGRVGRGPRGGGHQERPLREGGGHHERPPREGGGHQERPPREGGGHQERPPREGGGHQERPPREGEPRTPRDGEPGEAQGRRGNRRGRGGGTPGGRGGGTPGGIDRRSKEWEEKRRQNIEKMNEEMERIAEYERGQRDADKPSRNFLDDPRRSGPAPDTDRKEGSRRHVRNWGGLDFDNVKTGAELEKEWTSRRPGPKGSVDMTMSMTGRERAEYLRWKKEREQIDEERLARHRNATGQWRREWDAQKTDSMFKEDTYVSTEGTVTEQSTRRARGRTSRTAALLSDDSKRPPKAPTFGDFLSQGRSQGPRGDRSRGKGWGPKQSYSMHDNRWEAEKEEEKKEKEDKPKKEEKVEVPEPEEVKSKTSEAPKGPERSDQAEDDEDEWEDASDGEEEEEKEQTDPAPQCPKEQRTPRPKVHIPEPAVAQESPEGAKPLSPFCPLDHQPVSDWGEEMELLSPRSSILGESPLKPPSTEASPEQRKGPEEPREHSEGHSEDHDTGSGPSVPDPTDSKVKADQVEPTASSPDAEEQLCPVEAEQDPPTGVEEGPPVSPDQTPAGVEQIPAGAEEGAGAQDPPPQPSAD